MNNGGAEHCIHHLMHEVDLADFNPFSVPPMTEFLRDISDVSKSPIEQTIEAFIGRAVGCFQYDMVTAKDAAMTLRVGNIGHEDIMYTDVKNFTPGLLGKIMAEMPTVHKIRARSFAGCETVYVVRNHDEYERMQSSDVYKAYSNMAHRANKLRVVR